MRRLALILLVCLGACAAELPAPSTPTARPVEPQELSAPYRFAAIGIQFPAQIGLFVVRRHNTFGTADLGESISYQAPAVGGFADVYVYNYGLQTIADGVESEAVRQQLAFARQDLERAWPRRFPGAPAPRFVGAKVIRCGGPALLEAAYLGAEPAAGMEHDSRVLLTGFRNQFVKLRITLPARVVAERPAVLEQFISGVCAALAQGGRATLNYPRA
jgi:hypothetical protein